MNLKNLCISSNVPRAAADLVRFPQQESSEAQGLQRKPLAGGQFLKGDKPLMPHPYCDNTFLQRVYRPLQGAAITDLVL